MRYIRDRFSFLIPIAALSVALVGCNGGATEGGSTANGSTTASGGARPMPAGDGNTAGDKVMIGMVASLNGELRPWGADCEKGGQLAVEEFNKAGGINGKPVTFQVEDSASKPEIGKTAAEKLITDGALAIVGEVASGITGQMAQSAFEKGIPLVAVGATRTDITDIGANIFRVCYTDAFQGPVMAQFAYDELGLRNVALMTDKKQPYSTGLSDSFRQHFEKLGGKIVDEQFYESGQTTFTSQLTNLKAKNPDGLFLSGYFNETGPIARQAKEAGLNVKLMGGDGWDSAEILNSGGDAIVGGFFCNHYNNLEDRPAVQEFLAKWKAKYGGVPATTMGALGYDATMLTLQALKNAQEMNSKSLMDAISNMEDFPGVSGSITLKGQEGDPPKRALVVRLTKVTPENPNGQEFVKAYEKSDIK